MPKEGGGQARRDAINRQPEIRSGVNMWSRLADEAQVLSTSEPMLAGWLGRIFSDCSTIEEAACKYMAGLLADPVFSFHDLSSLMAQTFREPLEKHALLRDLEASVERDPAAQNRLNVFLNHKGFHALLLHRVGHWCWMRGRRPLALVLQGLTSRALAVDIHPAASIGSGVFVDHATGVVIGETLLLETTFRSSRTSRSVEPESARAIGIPRLAEAC